MAQYQSHISFSVVVGIAYAAIGIFFFNIFPELAFLASAIIVITGMLPDIDAKSSAPARELGGLLAAVSPIALIELYPGVRAGGIARVALVVVFCYFMTRVVVVRLLQRFTVHRGMVHSIPAAIITFEIVYLLFWDLYWSDRLYVGIAGFVGFLSHLVLDASGNIDLLGKALGKAEKKPAALKLASDRMGPTVFIYASMLVLGWFVARDVYPHLSIYAGIRY